MEKSGLSLRLKDLYLELTESTYFLDAMSKLPETPKDYFIADEIFFVFYDYPNLKVSIFDAKKLAEHYIRKQIYWGTILPTKYRTFQWAVQEN